MERGESRFQLGNLNEERGEGWTVHLARNWGVEGRCASPPVVLS